MDIKDIKTVSDLINQNEADVSMDDKVEVLTKSIYKEDPSVGMAVAINILRNLLSYHYDVTNQMIEADANTEDCINWAVDMNRIDEAINLLKTIKVWVTINS